MARTTYLLCALVILLRLSLPCTGQDKDNGDDYDATGYGDLTPFDTIDGRRVINANGLQFEIPSYASGITDIQQPSILLLPPFTDESEYSARGNLPTVETASSTPLPTNGIPPERSRPSTGKQQNKYSGSFGGPEGVLTPGDTLAENQPTNSNGEGAGGVFTNSPSEPSANVGGVKRKYTGSFGGPPGILVPYDNIPA